MNQAANRKGTVIRLCMLLVLVALAATASLFARQTKQAPASRLGLSEMVPQQFAGWRYSPHRSDLSAEAGVFINELFEGIYKHPDVGKVVLTVEYGSDSRRRYELHLPEICHRYRGDTVLTYPDAAIPLDDGTLVHAAQMEWHYTAGDTAALCLYWIVSEGERTTDTEAVAWRRLLTGLFNHGGGTILVRVDSFYPYGPTPGAHTDALRRCARFISDMHKAMPPKRMAVLFGNKG